MSSPSWRAYIEKSFPGWQVEDHSGNNFTILKDFTTAMGDLILIGVAEIVVYGMVRANEEGYLTLEEWNHRRKEDDAAGRGHLYDDTRFFQAIYLKDEQTGEISLVPGQIVSDLSPDVLRTLRDTLVRYNEVYWEGFERG